MQIYFLVSKLNERKPAHTVRQMSLFSDILSSLDHAGETTHPCTNLSCALDSISSVGDLLTLPYHCPPTYSLSSRGQQNFCCKLNYHLLVCLLWTWWTVNSVYRKAAGTLFLSSLSRLNSTSSLDLSSCSVFSILLIILLLLWTLSSLFLYIYL